jgi:hypothetical protein
VRKRRIKTKQPVLPPCQWKRRIIVLPVRYKRYFLPLGLLLLFAACQSPTNEENSGEPDPGGKTYLQIVNNTIYTVNIYINDPPIYANAPDTLRQTPANDSAQWELQPTAAGSNGDTLYFEYLIPVGNITLPYYASNTENIKIKKLEAGMVNTQEVPPLINVSTESIFVLIRNDTGNAIWMQDGQYTKNPYGSTVRDIPAGESRVYVFDKNITSLSGFTIGDLTRKNFTGTSLQQGQVYSFIYNDQNNPALFLVEPFDPNMAKNIWSIPTSTVTGRYLTVGFFAPRPNPADGYLMLGNINFKRAFVYQQAVKSAPYFVQIARNGIVSNERIIPLPVGVSLNQALFTSFIEESGKYVFLGQALNDTVNKPFIMSMTTGFMPNYYYDGFDSDLNSADQTLDVFSNGSLVRTGNGKYGMLCHIYDETSKNYTVYVANIREKAFDEVEHEELWRSSVLTSATYCNMVYDETQDMYIVLTIEYSPGTEDVLNSVIFFIDAQTGVEKFPRISQNKFIYSSIEKSGTDYYVAGYYKNTLGSNEGILDKLVPATGQLLWSANPKRFPAMDGSGNAGIWNILVDNGKLILSGFTNATDDNLANCKPWLCAFDIASSQKIWEQCYTDYNGYAIYSSYDNGIGSYLLEVYNYGEEGNSVLVSTDLLGRMTGDAITTLPESSSLNYTLQEFASLRNVNAVITPLSDVNVTPPVLEITRPGTGVFTVNGTYASYAWYVDGVKITGATGNAYTLQTSAMTIGVHTVTAVVGTSGGEKRSGSYTVRVKN